MAVQSLSAVSLLTQKQTAEFLQVQERTLEDWRRTGGGPPFVRISHRCVRYRLKDLDAWLEDRVKSSTSA